MQPEQTDAEFFSQMAARTVEELDGALACYYPVEGNNDLPEAMARNGQQPKRGTSRVGKTGPVRATPLTIACPVWA